VELGVIQLEGTIVLRRSTQFIGSQFNQYPTFIESFIMLALYYEGRSVKPVDLLTAGRRHCILEFGWARSGIRKNSVDSVQKNVR